MIARALVTALIIAVGAATAPATAAGQNRAGSYAYAAAPGHAARAQASQAGIGAGGISADRARALRECNGRVANMKGYNQLAPEFGTYRTCMMQHGQPE